MVSGLALSHAGHAGALARLREAHVRSLQQHDARGALMSASALVLTGHMVGNFRGMPDWLSVVAALKQPAPPLHSADDELLGRTALLIRGDRALRTRRGRRSGR